MAYGEKWEIEVRHDGLSKYRVIRGTDKHIVEQKALAQTRTWNEMWKRKREIEDRRQERELRIQTKEENLETASEKTQEAENLLKRLETTLSHTLSIDDTINWESLLDHSSFSEKKPRRSPPLTIPKKPQIDDNDFLPAIGLIDRIFSSRKKRKIEEGIQLYKYAYSKWAKAKKVIDEKNSRRDGETEAEITKWKERKEAFKIRQENANEAILDKKKMYLSRDPNAIVDYCEMVLSNSDYPDIFPQEWELAYEPEGKIIVLDYSLPAPDDIPRIKAVRYVASKDEFVESYLSQLKLNKTYDDLVYQTALRTIHEIFEADQVEAIDAVIFNGRVNSVDKATGKMVNSCIISLNASKSEFTEINLENVEAKACFKALKGVGSSKLHGISPIAPIMEIDKQDKRIVEGYNVTDAVSSGSNLAAMDWEDFENLIREIFEKEFKASGGEVKVTQASRDGGVDAIAFDPDPIRGGKIVIQAKRYTNVVGVSAVRDLYGTTMNEGATKGIIVTTSNYGPDAYEFAKGKPLVLLNGANLLHMLERHGHNARIDIVEAKKILAENRD